ncbi:ankyrin repeat domain-containing protein [Ehrlichia ruminantium]|uniref:ankyrin repeat domain-containing protein n=1 Tax=Ehrlichia ruminantium TaxID=779 RepID=UPI001FC8CF70|nr:ankyrin repeat domain-containing protein [Ehrlichia ruminantium]UOD98273.1 ankyrin repeat domain-containing protein [Ehrlichia ruminantium]
MAIQDLHDAIKAGDAVKVKEFFKSSNKKEISKAVCSELANGSGILQFIIGEHQKTPKQEFIEIFYEVLKHCDHDLINRKDRNGDSPVLMAASTDSLLLEALLKSAFKEKVDWNVCDHHGNGVLHHAINSGNIECIKALLNSKNALAHLSQVNNNNDNVLHAIVSKCIESGSHISTYDEVLHKISDLANEHEGSVLGDQIALSRLFNAKNKNGYTAAHLLVKNPTAFIKEGVDNDDLIRNFDIGATDSQGNSVLDLAVQNNTAECIFKMALNHEGTDYHKAIQKTLIRYIGIKKGEIMPFAYDRKLYDKAYSIMYSINRKDPEILSAIVNRCKKLSTKTAVEGFIDYVYIDLNIPSTIEDLLSCMLKSGNMYALRHFIDLYYKENQLSTKHYQKELSQIQDEEMLRAVVGIDYNSIIKDFSDKCLSPGIINALFNTDELGVSIKLINRLANSSELRKSFIENASGEQLAACMSKLDAGRPFRKNLCAAIRNEASKQEITSAMDNICSDILKKAFSFAEKGDLQALNSFLDSYPSFIYREQGGKSLLEVASDNGHVDIVQSLISLHNKNIKQAASNLSKNPNLMDAISLSFRQISKINSENVLKVIVENQDVITPSIESDILKNAKHCDNRNIISYLNSDRSIAPRSVVDSDAGTSSAMLVQDNMNRYGSLSEYVDAIRSKDLDRFKKEVLDKLSKNVKEYITRSHGNKGHTIFSLVAMFGSTEQWEALDSSYRSIPLTKKTKSLFPGDPLNNNRLSTICSPVQCAVLAGNVPMLDFFLKNIKDSELSAVYGDHGNNLIHTLVSCGKIDTVRQIIGNERFSRKEVIKALLQPNKDGITPFTMAFSEGYGQLCREILTFIKASQNVTQLKTILLDENLLKEVIKDGNVNLFQDLLDIQNHVNKSKSKTRIQILNHQIDGRNNLLSYVCKKSNVEFLELLLKCCEFQELFGALEDVIREQRNIKPEILEKLISHLVRCSSEEQVASKIVPIAIKHDVPEVLRHVINAVDINDPKFNIYDLITQNKVNMLRYVLTAKPNSLETPSGKEGMSNFAVAMCSPNMLEVCHEYLTSHPNIVLESNSLIYAAILSNNVELVSKLLQKDSSLLTKGCDNSSALSKQILSELKSRYKCNFQSGELLHDFAERVGSITPEMREYLKDAFLKKCQENIIAKAELPITNSLIKAIATSNDPEKYPQLCQYITDNIKVSDFLRESNRTSNNVFHLVNDNNIKFLCGIANECDVCIRDTKDLKIKSIFKDMMNKVRSSDGLSFFHILAANGRYDDYERIRSSVGKVDSLTSDGANVMHLCAKSGMKDKSGGFEFENLISNNGKLSGSVDRQGRGLLAYAASGSDKDLANEVVKRIIEVPHLDSNLSRKLLKSTQRSYIEKCLKAAFNSGNIEAYGMINSAFGESRSVPMDKMHQELLTEIGKDSDPTKAAKLLSDEYDTYAKSKKSLTEGLSQSSHNEDGQVQEEVFVSLDKKALLQSYYKLLNVLNSRASYDECLSEINQAYGQALQIRISGNDSIAEKAIFSGNVDFIKALTLSSKELNPNVTDHNGNTLLSNLIIACNQHPQLIPHISTICFNLVYKHNFSVNHKNSQGETPVSLLQVLKEKLEQNPSQNKFGLGVIERLEEFFNRMHHVELDQLKEHNSACSVYDNTGSYKAFSSVLERHKLLSKQFNKVLYDACTDLLSSDAVKHPSAADRYANRLTRLLSDSVIRKTLTNTDSKGDNILQVIFKGIAAGTIKSDDVGLTQLINMIVSNITENREYSTLHDLLFNNRNSEGESAIETLARIPNAYPIFKRLEELLDKGIISNNTDLNTVLVNAAGSGNVQLYNHICTKYAVDGLYNIDIHGNSSLHKAVISGSLDMVKRVLETGTDINRKNANGNTPLHVLLLHISNAPSNMVKSEHLELVKLLVSRGASLSERNKFGDSPSSIAPYIVNRAKSKSELPENANNVIDLIREGRKDHIAINSECNTELKSYIKLGKDSQGVEIGIVGAVISAKIDNGKIHSSALLNSDFCKKHSLSTVQFNLSDTDKGYVQKVGEKRNYVVNEGSIKLKLSWKPVGKNSKEQKVSVIINADGTISVEPNDIERCGENGQNLNFNNCKVYIGSLCLKDALASGKWRNQKSVSESQERTSQDKHLSSDRSLDDGMSSEIAEPSSTNPEITPQALGGFGTTDPTKQADIGSVTPTAPSDDLLSDSHQTIPKQYSASSQIVPPLSGFGITDPTKQADRASVTPTAPSDDLLNDSHQTTPKQYSASSQIVPPLSGFGITDPTKQAGRASVTPRTLSDDLFSDSRRTIERQFPSNFPVLPDSLFGSDDQTTLRQLFDIDDQTTPKQLFDINDQTTPKQFASVDSFLSQDSLKVSEVQDKSTDFPVTRPVAELGARSKIPLLGNLPKELKNPLVESVPMSKQKSVRAEVHSDPLIGESDTEELQEFSYSTRDDQFMSGATGGLANEDILQRVMGSLLSPEVANKLEETNHGIYRRVIDEQLTKTGASGTTLQVTQDGEHLGLAEEQTSKEKSVQAATSAAASQDTGDDEHRGLEEGRTVQEKSVQAATSGAASQDTGDDEHRGLEEGQMAQEKSVQAASSGAASQVTQDGEHLGLEEGRTTAQEKSVQAATSAAALQDTGDEHRGLEEGRTTAQEKSVQAATSAAASQDTGDDEHRGLEEEQTSKEKSIQAATSAAASQDTGDDEHRGLEKEQTAQEKSVQAATSAAASQDTGDDEHRGLEEGRTTAQEKSIQAATSGAASQVTQDGEHRGLEEGQTAQEKSVQAASSGAASQTTEHGKHSDVGDKDGVKGKVMRYRSSSTSALDENIRFDSEMLRRHRERLKSTGSSGILDEVPGQMKHVEPQVDQSGKNIILMSGLRPVVIQDARSRSSSEVSSDDIRKPRSQSVDNISDIVKEDHDPTCRKSTGDIRDAILGMSRSVYGSESYKKHMNDAMNLAQQSSQEGKPTDTTSFANELSKIAQDLKDVSMCETDEKNVPLSHTPSSGKSKTGASKSM